MTLHELLQSVDADEVVREIRAAYPDDPSEAGYRKVLAELLDMEPQADSAMTIVVERAMPDELNDEAWWHIHGRLDGDDLNYGLDLTPWPAWLAMGFRVVNCDLSPAQIAAHILWEMTYHGFDEDAVQEFSDKLGSVVDDLKDLLAELGENPTDEELKAAGLEPIDFEDDD